MTGTSVPTRRREMNVVMDDLGKMYIFGGVSDQYTSGVNSSVWLNDTSIFDSNLLTWTQVTPVNIPTRRVDFTATYLPKSKFIVYIGGREWRANGYSYSVNIKEVVN